MNKLSSVHDECPHQTRQVPISSVVETCRNNPPAAEVPMELAELMQSFQESMKAAKKESEARASRNSMHLDITLDMT